MRIVIHDYAGHPFQLQLSRALASRDHDVLHQYCASFQGPKGDLVRRPNDGAGLFVDPIKLSKPVDKNNIVKRFRSNFEHGRVAAQHIVDWKPDLVMTANTPLEAVDIMQRECWRMDIPHIAWVQDLIGVAFSRIVGPKVPLLGRAAGSAYEGYENSLLARSTRIIVISDDFKPFVPTGGPPVLTIENWAALNDMPSMPKDNEWSRAHGLDKTTNFVYSGTIGMKHNPGLLIRLAEDNRDRPEVRVVVVSEGESVEWLRQQAETRGLKNLILLPFQPMADLPKVLGSADVVIAVLEPSAGIFSVPSKVLTYLCTGRAILMAVPPENLAARIVLQNNAGLCVPPTDEDAFSAAAAELIADPDRRKLMGMNGRQYAERAFDIEKITDRFEAIFAGCRGFRAA